MESIKERELRSFAIKTLVEGIASPFWAWQCLRWSNERQKALEDLANIPAGDATKIARLQGRIAEIDQSIKAPADELVTLRKGD